MESANLLREGGSEKSKHIVVCSGGRPQPPAARSFLPHQCCASRPGFSPVHHGVRPRQVEEGYGRVPQSLVHPRTFAGDIIIFCGFGSAHGVGAWGSDHERRLVIVNYQVRRAWGR